MKEQKRENQFSGMTREEILLEARRQILRSAVLALAALIVIGVACYAWFANNRSVSANLSEISLNADCFELASEGIAGRFDSLVPGELGNSDNNWENKGTQTGNDNRSILWRISENSNIRNYGKSRGISPGSSGELVFYIIPKQSGQITLNCTLDIQCDVKENGQTAEQPLQELMRGHLLFICRYTENGKLKQKLVDLEDGHFQVTVPAEVERLQVTLEWCWPYLLSDAAKFDEKCDREVGEKTMSEWIVNSLMDDTDEIQYPQHFFKSTVQDHYVGEKLSGSQDTRIVITTDNLLRYAKRLGDYYNEADYIIGKSVKSIVICLRAEAA